MSLGTSSPTGNSCVTSNQPDFGNASLAAAIGLATTFGGGFLCGVMIDQFGSIGAISLWALGFAAGLSANKLTQRSPEVAWILCIACLFAFVVAEVCWIHWNIVGAETWVAALEEFPTFLKEYKVDAFIAAIFTFFGCQAAYRQNSGGRV